MEYQIKEIHQRLPSELHQRFKEMEALKWADTKDQADHANTGTGGKAMLKQAARERWDDHGEVRNECSF
jgi:hypothetical protein